MSKHDDQSDGGSGDAGYDSPNRTAICADDQSEQPRNEDDDDTGEDTKEQRKRYVDRLILGPAMVARASHAAIVGP